MQIIPFVVAFGNFRGSDGLIDNLVIKKINVDINFCCY